MFDIKFYTSTDRYKLLDIKFYTSTNGYKLLNIKFYILLYINCWILNFIHQLMDINC